LPIKIALPKGRLLGETATLLERAGWGIGGYHEGARFYRFKSRKFPALTAKLFHEKDIPIQVAIGNYDLGVCGLDWTEELLAKYPSSALVKVKNLGYGEGALYVAASGSKAAPTIKEMQAERNTIRIASEYPNLAESFAIKLRLRRFSVFPLWGAAEAYPPETAELALIPERTRAEFNHGLVKVSKLLNFSAFLIANKSNWETKDMSSVLASLEGNLPATQKHPSSADVERMTETSSQ